MSVSAFYDQLSPFYHLIYADWDASVRRQAAQLDSIIRELWGGRIRTVLDAACGVGTQAIGLAELGYAVTASDISPLSIARAEQVVAQRNLGIRLRVADLRSLSTVHIEGFDLVLACDNAIPHLLSDDEIRAAFGEMHRRCAAGGGALISVRDYDPADATGTKIVPYGMRAEGDRRYLILQVWEFQGTIYDVSMYFVEDRGGTECPTHVMRSQYYAVPVARLVELMTEAGFHGVRRIDERFFQPLIAGFKRA